MSEVSTLAALGRLLPSLLLIIGALLAIRWYARRGGLSGQPGLRVTARTGLSRTAAVAIVEADGRRFLVGATDQQVQLLEELAAAEDVATSTTPPGPGRALVTTDVASTTARSDSDPRMGFIERLQELTLRRPQPDPWRSLRAKR